jgi:hypothetical protein
MTSSAPRNPFRDQLLEQMRNSQQRQRGFEMRGLYVLGALLLLIVLVYVFRPLGGGAPSTPPKDSGALASKVMPAQDQAELERRKAERRQQLAKLYDGALLDAPNGSDFQQTDGYRSLLRSFLDHKPGQVAAQARWLDYAEALQDPLAWQGEWVAYRGFIVKVYPQRLKEKVWDRDLFWRGFIAQTDGDEVVAFDMIAEPKGVEEGAGAYEIEGIFYRTVTYETDAGAKGGPEAPEEKRSRTRTVPYLLAKSIKPVEAAGATQFPLPVLIVLILAIAWAVLRVVTIVRNRKRMSAPSAGFREMFDRQLRVVDSKGTTEPKKTLEG